METETCAHPYCGNTFKKGSGRYHIRPPQNLPKLYYCRESHLHSHTQFLLEELLRHGRGLGGFKE